MKNQARPLTLDTASGLPIYRQIVDWVKLNAAGGTLGPGAQLPTVRQLAVDLGVNSNTVARAYLELERMGVVHTLRGKGTFVAAGEPPAPDALRATKLRDLVTECLSKAAEFGFGAAELAAELTDRLPAVGPAKEE
jgi:GntR family transcriptional regulator